MRSVPLAAKVTALIASDRASDLFEGLWPISESGVSYNSFLIEDERPALIDLVPASFAKELIESLAGLIEPHKLRYIVLNHLEPDHAGALGALLAAAPDAVVLCSPRAKPLLASYYGITRNLREVADGESVSLGGRELTFYHIPFVHWPETMATWDRTGRVLFSCNAFGGYGVPPGDGCDDDSNGLAPFITEALRYYTNVVAKFSKSVLAAVDKVTALPLSIVAPAHGVIWRREPRRILELYRGWAEYAKGDNEAGVSVLSASMYGNTHSIMKAVARGIEGAGVRADSFDVARTHASFILPALWVNAAVALGAPTYEGNLHPAMTHLLSVAAAKRVVNKRALYLGSWGWSGGALNELRKLIEPLQWELVDHLEFAGSPTATSLGQAEALASRFAASLKRTG